MIMTVTNNGAADYTLPKIEGLCEETVIASGGGTADFGMSIKDLDEGNPKGNAAWKQLMNEVKKGAGDIVVSYAADANQVAPVVDDANEV